MGYRLAIVLVCLFCLVGCKRNVKEAQTAPQSYLLTYQVGAFTNAENAQALKTRLTEKGFTVITEQAVVNQIPFERVLVSYQGPLEFTYQAGAFTDRANAEGLRTELAAKGYDAGIDEAKVGDKTYFRVYVYTRGGIEELLSGLKEMGVTDPMFRDIKPL